MLYQKRKRFNKLSRSLGHSLGKIPLSPNQWTATSLVFGVITFYLLANQNFLLASVAFALAAFIDMIDGAIARESKKVTKLGGYLDSVADRLVEFLIILGLFLNGYQGFIIPISAWLFLLFFGSFMSTYTRSAAFEKEVFKDLKGGILEHTDRLLFFLLIIIVSIFSLGYASYLIVLMAVLTNVSALQRFLKAVKR